MKKALCFVSCLVWSVTTFAGESFFVSERVYQVLTQVEEMVNAERYAEARAELAELAGGRANLNPYEQALVHQIGGVIYAQMEDYAEAEKQFVMALRSEQLPDNLTQQTAYNLSQIYLFNERYRQAIALIQKHLLSSADTTMPDVYFMLANAYVGLEDFKTALVWAEKTLATVTEQIPESYFALAIHLHLTLEQYAPAEGLLEQVLATVPNKEVYWRQLAAVRMELDKPQAAMAALELGYTQGVLDEERDFLQLAGLYVNHHLPYKAAALLEHGLQTRAVKPDKKVYELLAVSWNNAREYARAIDPFTKAAEISDDGKLFLRLAHLYITEEDWQPALTTIEQALAKGGLSNPNEAQLLQGVVHTHLEQYETAEKIFIKCLDYEDVRPRAIEWLEFLGSVS